MTGVDDRVVSMQFDNAAFEAKMSETLKSLDKLKTSLDFANENRNLSDLENTGKSFSLGGIGNAVEGVSGKFLALATIGITALSNITNKAVNAGEQLLKSFTLDPITQGFENFTTKMTSISTILANTASKGTHLNDVQDSLSNLNDYANKTIYDFSQMTQNLGTFTAAGVDLKTSQESIKGIANVAAISGSNTEQASMAMYQLSQAMAAGQVHLQDWNSVVNAGMGGQVFQKALFDTGVALKAIPNVPVGESFEDWTKKGNSFRESLQSGWLTTKVLTTTLNSFSGDYNAAQLKQLGYSDAQAAAMEKLGQSGLQAATQIKSLKALMDMLKENTAAGWSQTFSILAGNYDQAVGLFTEIGNALGGVVAKSADARNKLLQGWSDLGGRTMLIEGFKNAIHALSDVFSAMKEGVAEIFPPTTAKNLISLTVSFRRFTDSLQLGQEQLIRIHQIFTGLAAAVDIVIHVVGGVIGVVKEIIKQFSGAGSGALSFTANMLDWVRVADAWLVSGGHLNDFFNKIKGYIDVAGKAVRDIIGWFEALFSKAPGQAVATNKTLHDFGETTTRVATNVDVLEQIFQRLGQRFHSVAGIFDTDSAAFQVVERMFDRIRGVLDKAGQAIHDWFSHLGANIAASLKPGDFDAGVDAVNIGLLGGIIVMLKKFMGIVKEMDLSGGIMDSIKETLEGVRGQLKAMQTELKARALEEIAIALGVLTASIVVLSLIDSAKLTKAMSALAAGMTELVATMKMMDSVASNAKDATKFAVLATGMTLIATAALILSGAVAMLAQLSWEQLAKGLGGVTAMLTLLVVTAQTMEGNAAGMVAAGISMIPLATGLVIMAGAVELFGHMSWETMAKGLIGIAGALGVIAAIMTAMPVVSLLAAGVAMIPLATGLSIMAGALRLFGSIPLGEMVKGLIAMAAALGIIAIAMNAMPLTLPITAAGLVVVGVALGIMAGGVKLMGSMDLATLAKGLGAIAVLLGVLVVATNLMSGALGGAAAMVVVAGALAVLSAVLIELSKLSWGDLAKGLAAIAAVFLVLGVAGLVLEPVIPALLGLGAAMFLVGAGFTLFGVGAFMVGKALEALAAAGKAGVAAMIAAFNMLLAALPEFIATLVSSLEKSVGNISGATGLMLKLLTVLLLQILETVIKLAPQIAMALVAIITSALVLIRATFPDVAQTALDMLLTMMAAIRDHTNEIVTLAVDILVQFANTMSDNVQRLVDSALFLLFSFLGAISNRANDIAAAGLNVLLSFIAAMINNVFRIVDFAVSVVIALAQTIGNETGRIVTAGADILIHFAQSLADNAYRVVEKGVDIVLAFLNAIGDQALKLANGAADALTHFLNGLADAIRTKSKEINDAGMNVASAIIDGITNGLIGDVNVKKVVDGAVDLAKKAYNGFMDFIKGHSPSVLFMEAAGFIAQGLSIGLDKDQLAENSAVAHAERIVNAFQETLSKIPDTLAGIDEFSSPTITPVLDLSKVHAGARTINDLMAGQTITPDVSTNQARLISTTADLTGQPAVDPLAAQRPTQVTFNQTINSPTALSTNDIYKNTNSQFARAKEELNI